MRLYLFYRVHLVICTIRPVDLSDLSDNEKLRDLVTRLKQQNAIDCMNGEPPMRRARQGPG